MRLRKFVKSFKGKEIRLVLKENKEFMFSAYDVGKALNLSSTRREVTMLNVTTQYKTELIEFEGSEIKLFMVDFSFLLDLANRAENDVANNLVSELVNNVMVNVASGIQDNNTEKKVKFGGQKFATTQIAKKYGLTAIELNKILEVNGIQFKVNDQWVLYESYQCKGYTIVSELVKGGNLYYHTYWTEAGVKFIDRKLEELGIIVNKQLDLFQ